MDFPKVVINRLTKEEVERALFRSKKRNVQTAQLCENEDVDISQCLSTQKEKKKKEDKMCSVKYRNSRNRGSETRTDLKSSNSYPLNRVLRYTFRKREQTVSHFTLTPCNKIKLKTKIQKRIVNNTSSSKSKLRKNHEKSKTKSYFDQSHFNNEVKIKPSKDLHKKRKPDSFVKITKKTRQRLSSPVKTEVKNIEVKKNYVSEEAFNILEIKDLKNDNVKIDYENEMKSIFYSEIEVIKEVENVWFKIEHTEPALHKNSKNERQQLGRSESVNELINQNAILTIPIPIVPKKTYSMEAEDQDVQIINKIKCEINVISLKSEKNVEHVGEVGLLKLKSSKALGTVKGNKNVKCKDQNDCKFLPIKIMKKTDSITEEVCSLYHHYFNAHVKSLLNTLIESIHSVLRQIYNNGNNVNDGSTKQTSVERNIQLNSKHRSILKMFSKNFVETFKKIQDSFEEIHKPHMIPVIYLHLIKAFENVNSVNLEDVRSIILRMFQIEGFTNKYDVMCKKTYEEFKKILFIFERWIGTFIKEKDDIETTLSVCYSSSSKNNVENEYSVKSTSVIEDKRSNLVEMNLADTLALNFSGSNDHELKVNSDPKEKMLAVETSLCTQNEESLFGRTNSDNKQVESGGKSIIVLKRFTERSSSGQHIQNQVTDVINPEVTRIAEDQRIYIFEHQEGASSLDCPNRSCGKKMTVPCYYCKELVGCMDLCQVEMDQFIGRTMKQNYILQLLACKAHKRVCWEESCEQDWGQVEDHEMPYEPQCWHTACDKRAVIICLCKRRAYCSLMCRVTDWSSYHHQNCSWQPDSDLLLHRSDSH